MVITRNFNFSIIKLFRSKFIGFLAIVFSIFLFNPLNSNAQVTFGEVGVAFADSSGNVLYEVDKNDYNIELNVTGVKYILMYTNSSTIKNNGYNLFYDFAIGYQGMQYPVGINVTQLLENRNSIQFTPSLFNVESQIQGAQGYYSRYHLNVDFTASSSNAWYQVTLQLPTEMNFTFYSVYNKKFTQISGNSGSQIESSTEDIIKNQDKNTQQIIDNDNKNHLESESTRKGILNTIKELPSKLLDMLISLFIPDDFSFLYNLKDSLESKLGFIAEIPISILEFTLNLANASWERFDTISFPSIEFFGVSFWNTQEISLQPAIDIFEPYKYITDILCVILCCNTLLKWYQSFTDGGGK